MGVPSPFLSASQALRSPHQSSVLATATPELPLLEAASEKLRELEAESESDFDLLPAAALDLKQQDQCEYLLSYLTNDGFTPATATPATPAVARDEASDVCSSTPQSQDAPLLRDLPIVSDMFFSEKNTFLEPVAADVEDLCVRRGRAFSEFTGLLVMRADDIKEIAVQKLKQPLPNVFHSEECNDESHDCQQGSYVPMWCRVRQLGVSQYVEPCPNLSDYAEQPLSDYCDPTVEYEQLWCWQQWTPLGLAVVPYTEKQPDREDDGTTRAEEMCAPVAPKANAYKPAWNHGPCWPFNAKPTSLMFSALPQELSQETFIEILDKHELCGYYDFVFMPCDFCTGQNQGSAIVNFTKHKYGLAAAALFHGRTAWGVGYKAEACQVNWSVEAQGLSDLVERYSNVAQNHASVPEEMRPQLYSEGWPTAFPAAEIAA